MTIIESGYLSDVELFLGGLQSLNLIQVGHHFKISSLVGSKKLVEHQLKGGMDVEVIDPPVFGKDELGYKSLALSFVVSNTEVTAYSLLDEVSFW